MDKSGTLVLKYKGGAMAVLLFSMDNAIGGNNLTLYGSEANLQVLFYPPLAPFRYRSIHR